MKVKMLSNSLADGTARRQFLCLPFASTPTHVRALVALVAVAGWSLSPLLAGSVFDDVLGYYCGGVDSNEDGIVTASEIRDVRRLGLPGAKSHLVEFGPADKAQTNAVRWTSCDVDCAVAGVTLKNQKCLDFTQVYTKADGTRADAAAFFTLPFQDDIGAGGTNKPFTILVRFRVPDTVTKVDGTVWDGVPVYGGNQGYIFDLGRNPSSSTGIAVGIPYDEKYNGICIGIGNGMDQSLLMTNETYRTKGACWNELAVRVPNKSSTVTNGFLARLFQPGMSPRTVMQNFNNATPETGKKFMLGNYNADQRFAFRGQMHMFAVWNRALSDDEIKEAFSVDPGHGLRSLKDAEGANSKEYVVGKPVFAVGNDFFGNEMFAGDAASDPTVDAGERSVAAVPARLAVGRSVTFRTRIDKYHAGYNSILRIKAAASSSAGMVAVRCAERTVKNISVEPGKYSSCIMPGELMGEDGVLSVAVECLSADGDGLAFDLFELGGSFAWSAGVKDNGDAEFFSGSMKQDFAVGADWISRFNRQVSSSVKDRRVMFCIPADIVGAYGFSLEFAACSISTLTPLKMSFNGRNVFSGVSLERYRDYRVRLPAECVTGGTNTLWYTSDNAQGDAVWINFDYMRLVPHAKKGLAVNVR